SSFVYDNQYGWLTSASSPNNLCVDGSNPDFYPSTSTVSHTADGLPLVTFDPMGHREAISYDAEPPGSGNLRVRVTRSDLTSIASVLLDPAGRVLEAVDERGIRTVWTYNAQGAPRTV